MRTHVLLVASISLFLFSADAIAQITVSDPDPCVKAQKKFKSTADALRDKADSTIALWDTYTEPPPQLHDFYVEALKKEAYKRWAEAPETTALLTTIKQSKPEFNQQEFFDTKVYPAVFPPDKEKEALGIIWKATYVATIKPQFLADRAELDKKINGEKASLDGTCKDDVFNKFVRVAFMRPVMIVQGNFAASKDEKDALSAALRATTGISLKDIGSQGLLGGDNSELRKLANSVAGGPNSEIRKGLRTLDEKLNPARWKF